MAFCVLPRAAEEDVRTAMFVGAACDSGYCRAVGFEGMGNTPLWNHQLHLPFSAAQWGQSSFRLCWLRSLDNLPFGKVIYTKCWRMLRQKPALLLLCAFHTMPASSDAGWEAWYTLACPEQGRCWGLLWVAVRTMAASAKCCKWDVVCQKMAYGISRRVLPIVCLNVERNW